VLSEKKKRPNEGGLGKKKGQGEVVNFLEKPGEGTGNSKAGGNQGCRLQRPDEASKRDST